MNLQAIWDAVTKGNTSLDALTGELKEIKATLETRSTELTAVQQSLKETKESLSTAQAEALQLKTDLDAEKVAHEATRASVDEKIKTLASAKALEIAQGQGIPPIASAPNPTPAKSAKEDISNLHGLEKAIAAHKSNAK